MAFDVYTMGFSNRTWEETLKILRAFEIRRLVDIRTLPGSMSKAKIRETPADFKPFAMFEPASPKPMKPTVSSLFMGIVNAAGGRAPLLT